MIPCGYKVSTRLQAARSPAASEALTRQGRTTPDYHNQRRSLPTHQSTLLALTNQPRAVLTEGNTRALLQAEQQQQLDLQGSSTAYEDVDSNQIASEAGIIADTAIRTDTASLSQTKSEALLVQRHEPQSAVQEYQPSNAAVLNEPRLISAAASQASQSLADSIEETAGEDQFDAWPLVDPPFQDALHEVQYAYYSWVLQECAVWQLPTTSVLACSVSAAASCIGYASTTTCCCGMAPFTIPPQVPWLESTFSVVSIVAV